MAIKIARGTDPFRKYWWVILALFGGIGGWVCVPLMGGNTGSGSVSMAESGLRSAEQSLDSPFNPGGAPGHAVDLSMDDLGPYKRDSGPITDSLFQAPPASAPKTASASTRAKSNGTLADALNDIASRSRAAAMGGRADASASIPFNPPHANFGSLSGLGGGESASAASVSYASPGSGGAHLNAFGSDTPNTGVAYTHGLGNDSLASAAGGGAKAALQSAAGSAIAAAQAGNADSAANMIARNFDGAAQGGTLVGGPKGGSAGGVGIDGKTPIDLKPSVNDYGKLNQQTLVPNVTPTPPVNNNGTNIMQMLMMAFIGGLPMLLMSGMGM